MDKTLILSTEICRECNYAAHHAACPSGRKDRFDGLDTTAPLTTEKIIEVAYSAHALGFRGYHAFHFYNEPLMAAGRMIVTLREIRKRVPSARFLLWTNGALIPKNGNAILLAHFDKIVITDYDGVDWSHVRAVCPDVYIQPAKFDRRNEEIAGEENLSPCFRPYNELPIDYFGNVHLCCQDWRGRAHLGNVWRDDFKMIVSRFQNLRMLAQGMSRTAPDICRCCIERDSTPGGSARTNWGGK